ncbi:DNA helicase IV [Jatrophihabitans sp. GAS493]|uniref:HelD family protein n=1 Tax=Jatrophihabitans sp. GAS493 TaxID=1907575 RepID=UPI000BBF9A47|nr:AAA family ATPase [Jatrophihabitans sp. GAS493]SOD71365.1 DNA helicase IV [Jatrophihabitans sp. GAS493]
MTADSVLDSERAHLDLARTCLVTMRDAAERIADYGVDALASEALGRIRAERLAALEIDPHAPPFFGRTDNDITEGTAANRSGVETFHIGRRHIRDPAGDPVVIDWRAPIARAFYRATSKSRMGVTLRRRFGFHAGALSSFEDEHLDRGEESGLDSNLLRGEIERPRSGPMRDIVATIQPDQDDLVRAQLDESLCIQGAPGTGKTAVGLHRAAYLLYTYPERLRRSGVLVVGPNAAFLSYIAQVLPALGEGGIAQTTVDELVGHVPVRAVEPDEVATLKGDPRLATVLAKLVRSHIRKPVDDVLATVGDKRYRIPEYRVRRYVDDARRDLGDTLRWGVARDRLRQQLAEDVRRQREDRGGAPSDSETAKVARSKPVRAAVDELWPALDPANLLIRLFSEPELLRRHGGDLLSEEEQQTLLWAKVPRTARAAKFSAADAVLIDELHGLLNSADTYVHVVVDEAQDLSPMQCRAIARRCPLGSVTVLGDLAQATTAWAPGAWPVTLEHLGHPKTEIRPLTAGYRVPGEVLELANRLLPHVAVDVPPATSIRAGVDALTFVASAALVSAVQDCLSREGSVAVIVADDRAEAILQRLRDAGVEAATLDSSEVTDDTAASSFAEDDTPSGDRPATASDPNETPEIRVTVVPATAAKGLEFDSVVLLEPAAIVAAESQRVAGLRRLYVVLTRAVSRLVVVHDEPLPSELIAA